ncbi:MAG: hypothetical protein J6V44_14995 [Methanobrevibacter sp.]|nr:hypothetical protein [Methanobrevibacter sp.]
MSITKEVSKIKFDMWVSRMINDCIRNTGIHDRVIKDLASFPDVNYEKRLLWDMRVMYTNKGHSGNVLIHHQFMVYISEDENYLRLTNIVNGKSGYSKKNTFDKFDAKIALAVAWARYCKNTIPKLKTYLTKEQFLDLENGNIFYSKNGQKFIAIGIEPQTKDMMVVYREKDKNLKEIVTIPYIKETYSFEKI